jgi:hypothetical protein
VIVAVITAVPLLVFVSNELVAIPVGPVVAVEGLISPYAGSSIVKVTCAPDTAGPDILVAVTVITERSYPFATGHSLLAEIVPTSATIAETVPKIRKRPSRIKSPAFARITNTLEK